MLAVNARTDFRTREFERRAARAPGSDLRLVGRGQVRCLARTAGKSLAARGCMRMVLPQCLQLYALFVRLLYILTPRRLRTITLTTNTTYIYIIYMILLKNSV